MIYPIMLASASNEFTGQLIFGLAAIFGLVATLVSLASYFATRREVEELKQRVDKLERRTSQLDKRINRLLAGQYLIAGQMGVMMDRNSMQSAMERIAAEEEEYE